MNEGAILFGRKTHVSIDNLFQAVRGVRASFASTGKDVVNPGVHLAPGNRILRRAGYPIGQGSGWWWLGDLPRWAANPCQALGGLL